MFLVQCDTQLIRSERGWLTVSLERNVVAGYHCKALCPNFPLSPHSPTTQARPTPLELYLTRGERSGVCLCVLGGAVVPRTEVACRFSEDQMRGNHN